jgi:hypothetical protein
MLCFSQQFPSGNEAVTLSVTEAELVAATTCIQEMIYTKKIVESMGLKVKLPMELYVI